LLRSKWAAGKAVRAGLAAGWSVSQFRETHFDTSLDVGTATQSNALPEQIPGDQAGEASEWVGLKVSRILGYIVQRDNLLWQEDLHRACPDVLFTCLPDFGRLPAKTNAKMNANTANPSTMAAGAMESPKIPGFSLEAAMAEAQQPP